MGVVEAGPPRKHRPALTLLTGVGSLYFLLEMTSRYVPGPVGDLTGLDERIRIFDRVGNLLS